MAPSANAAAHGSPATTACVTTATAVIIANTSPKALMEIVRACARSASSEAKYAALNSSGGRTISRTRSGFELDVRHRGEEPERAAAEHDQDRIRQIEQPREPCERRDGDQEKQRDDFD